MNATAVVFPFDNFGAAGTGEGALLLGDVLREAIDDTLAEDRPTRPHKYATNLEVRAYPFETLTELAAWRADGRAAVRELLTAGQFVLWLSGNHLGVLPVYDELGPHDVVIQFDAHLDCYVLHDTTTELSHGNFLLHVEGRRPKVVNVGHRDLFLLPKDVKKVFAEAIPAEAVAADLGAAVEAVRGWTAKADRVWIDLDADAIDPAFAPGVAQPTPFGLTPQQLMVLVGAAWSDKVAGVSVSEFDPGRDRGDTTLQLLGWLAEWVLLKRFE